LVYVPAALQLERLVARGVSEERARAIIAAQMPIEEKRAKAQHVIDNSGSQDATRQQVQELWERLTAVR
jgi:dephospho-CoA kinase